MSNKNTWARCALLVVFSLSLSISKAQTLKHIGVEDGLPSNFVYSIFEDSLGFIWFATNNGAVKYDGYRFTSIDFKSIDASNDIWEIYDDKDGRIWFSSEKKLVYLENGQLYSIPFPDSRKNGLIKYHHFDKKNNHIVYFDDYPYRVLKPKGGKPSLQAIEFKDSRAGLKHYIKEDDDGSEWFMESQHENIILYKSKNGLLGHALDTLFVGNHEDKQSNYTYTYMYGYPKRTINNEYLAVHENGIFKIDFKKAQFVPSNILAEDTKITHAAIHTQNISKLHTNKGAIYLDKHLKPIHDLDILKDVTVNVAFEDSNGNLWICTFGNGVYFLQHSHRGVQKINRDINGHSALNIFDTATDPQGNIWFTNNSKTIWKINEHNEAIPYKLSYQLKKEGEVIRYIEFDKYGNLYLSSSQYNCFIISNKMVKSGNFNQHPKQAGYEVHTTTFNIDFSKHDLYSIKMHYVKHISPTKNGDVVIGNVVLSATCYSIDENHLKIDFHSNSRNYAGTIWKDNLVIGHNTDLTFIPLKSDAEKIKLKLTQSTETLLNDQEGYLWISTKNDCLYRYDGSQLDSIQEINQFKLRVFNMLEIGQYFWLSTNKGLARLKINQNQPFSYDFKLFTEEHGLVSTQVYETNYKNGYLYLATQNGIDIFPIEKFGDKDDTKPILFTHISLNGRDSLLKFSDYGQEPLTLQNKINNIKIGFTCLPYLNEKKVYYEYRTEGIQTEWQSLYSNTKEFDINTLRPGKYKFEVRARNINGIISKTLVFQFQILPPWWNTWWAYLGYFLCFTTVFYYLTSTTITRKKIQAENKALAELDNAKTNFFTNITHELRTPLTILSSLVQLEEEEERSPKSKVFLNDMKTHTKTMLHLINQLLDISKLEAGSLPIYLEVEDLVNFCKDIVILFSKNAQIKHQKLHFYSNSSSFLSPIDGEKLERIIYNILSNAIKYTQEHGTIEFFLKIDDIDNAFSIEIKDNGSGINEQFIESVFDKFMTVDNTENNSTGVGLYLAKEMAKLLGGDISLQSNEKGSTFTIDLPLNPPSEGLILDHFVKLNTEKPISNLEPFNEIQLPNQEHIPQLLLVDDNPDLLQLLSKILVRKYRVVSATNGEEAINIATENVPELIISDIMMPMVDGFELCKRLKSNLKTSHIPIILLSAKNTKSARIKGTALGANAYLSKPFNHQQLLETIEGLLVDRKTMRDNYNNLSKVEDKTEKNNEDKFVLRLKSLVEENVSNIDLDVNFLCSSLYMSRTQLHNKLKYTTGMSTRKFIRRIRLDKAKELMRDPNLKITHIAFEIGMQPKYFSRVFHETYGESPSQFRKRTNLIDK